MGRLPSPEFDRNIEAVKIQLPTLGEAAAAAGLTFARFPFVMLAALVTALAGMLEISDVGPDQLRSRLMAAASLGLPLLTAVALFCERRRADATSRSALTLAATLVLAAFYFAWPEWSEQLRFDHYAQLSLAFHLAVAFVPLLGSPGEHAFWNYNLALFRRFLAAAAFSATLFLGLVLALAAMNPLFGLEIEGEGYGRLWMAIAFGFNTAFFLGGVPRDLDALSERQEFPNDLRVFAQYALVPLVSIYLVILSFYLGKVLVTWNWPSGWTGWLVSGVAAAGTLALLLVYPIADDPAQKWIAAFARSFWIAVLPFIVMLWMALYQRVQQYGLTEHRYFAFVLSLWLAALAVFYVITRSRTIRLIPASLCAVSLLSFAGPWSAYSMARSSQMERLEEAMREAGMLADAGSPVRATGPVQAETRKRMHGSMSYLMAVHGRAALEPLLGDSLLSRHRVAGHPPQWQANQVTDSILVALGAPDTERPAGPRDVFAFTPPINVAEFEWLVPLEDRARLQGSADAPPHAGLVADSSLVEVRRGSRLIARIRLDSLLARLDTMPLRARNISVPDSLMTVSTPNVVLRLSNLRWETRAGRPRLRAARGWVLVRSR